ncbi:MAG: PRC-barrel domain-containing protein [Actinobacteria bacterium]|nr:PRC-barrel domain-containing protein [Actinomycetota bacterium]
MLRSVNEQLGYDVLATDGEMGKADDILFDDETWEVRYLVVETGSWLSRRRVLIAPDALRQPEWDTKYFPVVLTREQVEKSPEIDLDKPVSLQHQALLHEYYSWPAYWTPEPAQLTTPPQVPIPDVPPEETDSHLRSCREVTGYHIHALDGEIGHVEDFILDDDAWSMRYMIVDTRNWLPGRKVLVSPAWVDNVSWSNRMVYVDLLREVIENAPEYDPAAPVNREYEIRLYDYYGRPRYW